MLNKTDNLFTVLLYLQPFASVGNLVASGLVMQAKQLAAAPQVRQQSVPVGRFHTHEVAMAIKGCQPPSKVYTDVRIEADDLQGACPLPTSSCSISSMECVWPNNDVYALPFCDHKCYQPMH